MLTKAGMDLLMAMDRGDRLIIQLDSYRVTKNGTNMKKWGKIRG